MCDYARLFLDIRKAWIMPAICHSVPCGPENLFRIEKRSDNWRVVYNLHRHLSGVRPRRRQLHFHSLRQLFRDHSTSSHSSMRVPGHRIRLWSSEVLQGYRAYDRYKIL